jgi:predicted nucleotide-binding protein (sugar kinase/HSP70/actin superfamily)
MTIGLPRAMLYYRYKVLWETFFKELNCDIITSEETNKKILNDGINFSIDECCLPAKIFMGHVYSLIGKCNYILIPRIVSYGKKNDVCVKFNALYDIVKNTFENANILDYNINVLDGENEKKGFIKMGRALGKSYMKSLIAYKKAKRAQIINEKQKTDLQAKALKSFDEVKILIVSHPYNTYDKLIGYPISQYIKKLGGIPIYADATDRKESLVKSKEISESLYWIYNKELIGSIKLLEDKIDGIILLTAFPCGPDSLVNELIIRKSKKIPTINIILDELQGEAGLQTRIESFMDIIKERANPIKL